MLVRPVFAIAVLLLAPSALAQPSQAVQRTCAATAINVIDVATVKPSDRSSGDTDISGHPDSLTVDASALRMILFAYKLHDFQLIGGPGWLTTSAWEATAKVDQPPAGYSSFSSDARDALQRQRMQAVLAERFNLKCHFETRELPVYHLVLAKSGAKLKPTPAGSKDAGSIHGNSRNRLNRLDCAGISLEMTAALLSERTGRFVMDKTGLTGLYDFTLTYTSDPDSNSSAAADDAASGPTIFTALEEQLGLRLESARGPVPVLVVDSIDRPSED